jgi:hypothetical protein
MAATGKKIEYLCSLCGTAQPRDQLVAKQVRFYPIGKNASPVRTRTVAWIGQACGCLTADPEWNLPRYNRSPGAQAQRPDALVAVDAC